MKALVFKLIIDDGIIMCGLYQQFPASSGVSRVSPQSLVQTEAREVEETQIFFCHHATEVIAAETNTHTHTHKPSTEETEGIINE